MIVKISRVLGKKALSLARGAIGYLAPLIFFLAAIAAHVARSASVDDVFVTPDQKFHMALEAQSEVDYEKMVRLLRESAETGNVKAQETLGMALLVGSTLYGKQVQIDRCEAGKWMRLAAEQGSEIGKFQWTFLGRLRNAPSGKDVCDGMKE